MRAAEPRTAAGAGTGSWNLKRESAAWRVAHSAQRTAVRLFAAGMDHGPSFRSFHGAEPLASLPPSAIDPMFLDFPAVTRWLLPPASLHDLPGRQPSHLASTSVTMRALQLPGAPDSERITVCTKRTPALAPILHLVAAMLECRRQLTRATSR